MKVQLQTDKPLRWRPDFEGGFALDSAEAQAVIEASALAVQRSDAEEALRILEDGQRRAGDWWLGALGRAAVIGADVEAEIVHCLRLAFEAKTGLQVQQCASAMHGVARIAEREGRYQRAWDWLVSANLAYSEGFPHDRGAHDKAARLTIELQTGKTLPASIPGAGDPSPIVILGLPRSGSTLLEQVLSMHPEVTACGEDPCFSEVLQEVSREQQGLEFGDFEEVGYRYVDRMRAQHHVDTPRFVDKQLSHEIFLGVMARALPRARFLLMERPVKDVAISCFRQDFHVGHGWKCTPRGLAAYFRMRRDLRRHWLSFLPPAQVRVVDYVELVQRPRDTVEELLEWLGLPWHEDCLTPERSTRHIETASALQVRQPISAKGIGLWPKRYKRAARPLWRALQKEGL